MDLTKEYITRKELSEIANKLENYQDKFILFAIYHGITGFSELSELRELKVSDIDFKKKIIKVGNRVVEMDNEFCIIAKRAIEQKTYYIETFNNHTNSEMKLNTDSVYVVRGKQMASNNWGTEAMKYSGLRSRFKLIREITGLTCSPSELETSGVVNRLLEVKKNWTSREIDHYLANLNLRYSAFRIYTIIKKINEQ